MQSLNSSFRRINVNVDSRLVFIDRETKTVTPANMDVTNVPVVFCISFRTLEDDKGDSRDPLNTANCIAKALPIDPIFIDGDDKDAVQEFLFSNPDTLLVGINLKLLDDDFRNTHNNFVSVGANYWSSYSQAPMSDIVLNASFQSMCDHWDYDKYISFAPSSQLSMEYTCVHSRVEKNPPDDMEKEVKTVMVYIRSPWDYPFSHEDTLLETLQKLREKNNCRFLVSTGPSGADRARKIRMYIDQLPDSEFYDFSENRGDNNPWISFLEQADAGIVTDDTISSACDMVHAGIPIFLHTNPDKAALLIKSGDDEYSSSKGANAQNYRFQKTLIEQGRMKILTDAVFQSLWQPPSYDEWDKIGKRIADVITNKQHQLKLDKNSDEITHIENKDRRLEHL